MASAGEPTGATGLHWRQIDRTGQSWTGLRNGFIVAQVVHYTTGWRAYVHGDPIDDTHHPSAEEAQEACLARLIADLDAGQ